MGRRHDRAGGSGLFESPVDVAAAWEGEGVAGGAARPIIGAVDATFVERMMVVCMDLVSGSLVVEEVADQRT